MNSLIRIAFNNSTKCLVRPLQMFQLRFKSNNSEPIDEIEQIKIIENNEINYFKNVKDSFDSLKKNRLNETIEEKRSRLMYQSRKRGTSENGILLSNFSADFLQKMNESELNDYDNIINNLHNEWDLYYWLTNAVPIPVDLKNSNVLVLMKKYCLNEESKARFIQPDLAKIN
jgi:succinate dehydrogenase assembly factor 2